MVLVLVFCGAWWRVYTGRDCGAWRGTFRGGVFLFRGSIYGRSILRLGRGWGRGFIYVGRFLGARNRGGARVFLDFFVFCA